MFPKLTVVFVFSALLFAPSIFAKPTPASPSGLARRGVPSGVAKKANYKHLEPCNGLMKLRGNHKMTKAKTYALHRRQDDLDADSDDSVEDVATTTDDVITTTDHATTTTDDASKTTKDVAEDLADNFQVAEEDDVSELEDEATVIDMPEEVEDAIDEAESFDVSEAEA